MNPFSKRPGGDGGIVDPLSGQTAQQVQQAIGASGHASASSVTTLRSDSESRDEAIEQSIADLVIPTNQTIQAQITTGTNGLVDVVGTFAITDTQISLNYTDADGTARVSTLTNLPERMRTQNNRLVTLDSLAIDGSNVLTIGFTSEDGEAVSESVDLTILAGSGGGEGVTYIAGTGIHITGTTLSVRQATTGALGGARIATNAEVDAGANTTTIVNPEGLQRKVSAERVDWQSADGAITNTVVANTAAIGDVERDLEEYKNTADTARATNATNLINQQRVTEVTKVGSQFRIVTVIDGVASTTLLQDESGGGSTGTSVSFGSGIPAPGLGENNDVYFDLTSGKFYRKSGGAWSETADVAVQGELLMAQAALTTLVNLKADNSALLTEVSSRESADAVLGGRINTEATTRAAGDTSVRTLTNDLQSLVSELAQNTHRPGYQVKRYPNHSLLNENNAHPVVGAAFVDDVHYLCDNQAHINQVYRGVSQPAGQIPYSAYTQNANIRFIYSATNSNIYVSSAPGSGSFTGVTLDLTNTQRVVDMHASTSHLWVLVRSTVNGTLTLTRKTINNSNGSLGSESFVSLDTIFNNDANVRGIAVFDGVMYIAEQSIVQGGEVGTKLLAFGANNFTRQEANDVFFADLFDIESMAIPKADTFVFYEKYIYKVIAPLPEGSGLQSVATDNTITGDGTLGSELGVAIPFTASEKTKLDGIEAGADVTEDYTGAAGIIVDNNTKEIRSHAAARTQVGTARLALQSEVDGGVNTHAIMTPADVQRKLNNYELGNNAVEEANIRDGAVTENKLGAGAVTANKIGAAAVREGNIGSGQVTESKLAQAVIDQLGGGSGGIADGSVTTIKLADEAVTEDKLAQAVVDQLGGSGGGGGFATEDLHSFDVTSNSFTGLRLQDTSLIVPEDERTGYWLFNYGGYTSTVSPFRRQDSGEWVLLDVANIFTRPAGTIGVARVADNTVFVNYNFQNFPEGSTLGLGHDGSGRLLYCAEDDNVESTGVSIRKVVAGSGGSGDFSNIVGATDLNTLIVPGRYATGTTTNHPVAADSGGTVIVERNAGGDAGFIRQTYQATASFDTFSRYTTDATADPIVWLQWDEVNDRDVKDNHITTARIADDAVTTEKVSANIRNLLTAKERVTLLDTTLTSNWGDTNVINLTSPLTDVEGTVFIVGRLGTTGPAWFLRLDSRLLFAGERMGDQIRRLNTITNTGHTSIWVGRGNTASQIVITTPTYGSSVGPSGSGLKVVFIPDGGIGGTRQHFGLYILHDVREAFRLGNFPVSEVTNFFPVFMNFTTDATGGTANPIGEANAIVVQTDAVDGTYTFENIENVTSDGSVIFRSSIPVDIKCSGGMNISNVTGSGSKFIQLSRIVLLNNVEVARESTGQHRVVGNPGTVFIPFDDLSYSFIPLVDTPYNGSHVEYQLKLTNEVNPDQANARDLTVFLSNDVRETIIYRNALY